MKKTKNKKGCLGCLGSIIVWLLKSLGLIFALAIVVSLTQSETKEPAAPEPTSAAAATQTATVAPVSTPTPIPTNTPTVSPTAKPTSTPTPAPTGTPKPTATTTPQPTQAPTATPAPTNKPEPTATPQPTASPEPTPEPLVMPGIGGSNAYDVVLSLADLGVSKPETTHIDGGYQWSSNIVSFGTTSVVYDIIANRDHEICHATFNMSGKDNGFLTYCATLPYDAADKDAATAFVEAHMTGDPATLVIGDALFAIYPDAANVMLVISDVNSEAYFLAKLDELN